MSKSLLWASLFCGQTVIGLLCTGCQSAEPEKAAGPAINLGDTEAPLQPPGPVASLAAKSVPQPAVWPVAAEKKLLKLIGHGDTVTSLAVTPDGMWALSGSLDKTARLWDLSTGREEKRLTGANQSVSSVAISPDGRWGLTAAQDKTVRVYDLIRGQATRAWRDPVRGATTLAFSPDGKLAAAGGQDGMVRVWDLAKGKVVHAFQAHPKPVNQLVFNADGTRLLSASDDRTAVLWQLRNAAPVARFRGHSGWVTSAVLSPDGTQVLTGSADQTVRLWSVAEAELLRTYSDRNGPVSRVQFLGGGRLVAAAMMPLAPGKGADYAVDIWERGSGRAVQRLSGHRGPVVVLAPIDDNGVLTASTDETLRLWALPPAPAAVPHPMSAAPAAIPKA